MYIEVKFNWIKYHNIADLRIFALRKVRMRRVKVHFLVSLPVRKEGYLHLCDW